MTTELDPRPSTVGPSSDRADRLFAAAIAIVSARTVDEMLLETTARAAEIVGAHQATTSLSVDGDAAEPITVTHSPTGPGSTVKPGEAARSGPTAEVCRTNRPLRLTHAELERRTDWGGATGRARRCAGSWACRLSATRAEISA